MQMNDNRLDDLFADLRNIKATPSDALMARLAADALRERELLATANSLVAERPAGFSLRLLVDDLIGLIGGWRPALGMAASLCCGIWLGAVGTDPTMLLPALGLDQPAITFELPEDPVLLIETPEARHNG